MKWEREAANRIPNLLQGWLQAAAEPAPPATGPEAGTPDLAARVGNREFLVEVRGSDGIPTIERAVQLLESLPARDGAVKLIAVPFMGPKARAWMRQRGISWLDLSGNAEIRDRDLCIVVAGEENRYAAPGRPSNPFAPRSARVSRALLVHPDRWWRQTEIADEVELPRGTVSKAVQRLAELELLERNDHGEIRAQEPSLLLESWAQRYRFEDHSIRRYHAVARSGPEGLRSLTEALSEGSLTWAATGLSAAWMYTAFADFRLNTVFVDQHPREPESLGLRPVDRGENVWLVVPHDEGVFYGVIDREGRRCAHPTQAYLDLAAHPERAADAARELSRSAWLDWSR